MESLKNQLEKLIDEHSLIEVVEGIGDVCFAKALHLKANWQDDKSSKTWESISKQLFNLAGDIALP